MISTQRQKNCKSSKKHPPGVAPNGRGTCGALIEAGASEWSIYTKDELRTLCEQNRVAPLTPAELRKVHEIKRTFHGRI